MSEYKKFTYIKITLQLSFKTFQFCYNKVAFLEQFFRFLPKFVNFVIFCWNFASFYCIFLKFCKLLLNNLTFFQEKLAFLQNFIKHLFILAYLLNKIQSLLKNQNFIFQLFNFRLPFDSFFIKKANKILTLEQIKLLFFFVELNMQICAFNRGFFNNFLIKIAI